jgi:hypothetical protein
MSAVEIHCELCAAYGQNVNGEGTVAQWCRMFRDGEQMFIMNSEVVGWPYEMSDDPVQSVEQKICEIRQWR